MLFIRRLLQGFNQSRQFEQSHNSQDQQSLLEELADGMYLEFLEQQSHKQQNMKQFIKTLTTEIQEFQQNVIQQTKLLIDHLNSIDVGQLVDQEIIQNYQNILNRSLDCNNVNQLIKIVQPQHSFNEKQLKDGNNDIQGFGTSLNINIQNKIKIMKPKSFYKDIQEKCQMQGQRIKFIQSKLEELNVDLTYKLNQWTKTVESLFSFQQISQFTLIPQTKSKVIKSAAVAKIELHNLCKDTLIYAQQNQIHLFDIDTMKMSHSVKFNQSIVDYTVDSEKLLIAIMIGIDLLLYNLISLKKIRHFKITIDTSKGVALKFFENQICVSSGVSLQFFPLFPSSSMPQFNQSLNFHSYWDKIKVLEYCVINKFGVQEMLLILGTTSGLISLFSSNFKELFSKQFHQGPINQFRYQQSKKYGKVLLSIGDDLRVNLYQIENTFLKCIQMITFESQILDVLLFKNYFLVTTKNQNLLEIYMINENTECQRIEMDGDFKCDWKDRLFNIGEKVVIVKNQIYFCKLL
ncbi:unnamed protein product [Paramecium octaurelia]|uniref:Uncharacterized protein n=1 Tax=Paramecium octaurelia TaxID=43137 RepID=A0A8S1UY68_PAROT|nr:unnamed protein product [Paramecium octaurelia]